jgi:hypothetical protein
MKCRGYRKLIVLYLYRELADEKRRRLEEHLDRCAACRREVEAFRAVIDRAGQREPAVPSNRAIEGIRHAALVGVGDAGRRASWGGRWYGARAGVVAAVCSVILIAAVVTLTARVGQEPAPASEPPVIVAEPPELSPNLDGEQMGEGDPLSQPDRLMQPLTVPTGIETRLATLEADTFYIGRELALETAPALDRRMQSLEDGVVTLALEWE